MSDLWGYTPQKCDNNYCPMDCDKCSKAEMYGNFDELLEGTCFNGTEEQRQKILNIAEDDRFSEDDIALAIWMCSSEEYDFIKSEVDCYYGWW